MFFEYYFGYESHSENLLIPHVNRFVSSIPCLISFISVIPFGKEVKKGSTDYGSIDT